MLACSLYHISDLEPVSSSWEAGRHHFRFSAVWTKYYIHRALNTPFKCRLNCSQIVSKFLQRMSQLWPMLSLFQEIVQFSQTNVVLQEGDRRKKYVRPNYCFVPPPPGLVILGQTAAALTPTNGQLCSV